MIKFYFPRWFWPENLGDSIISTFIPRLLNHHYNDKIEVITHGNDLIECFKENPYVCNVREPYKEEIKSMPEWISRAHDPKQFCVCPDFHPQTWKTWSDNFDNFYNHPTANIITLSYLLQLGLEQYIFTDYNLLPFIPVHKKKPKLSNKLNIAIVPADKLGGRPTPHPGCDGIGLRLNGSNGIKSWKIITKTLKNSFDCTLYEFSFKNYNLGDVHIPHISSYVDLATFCKGFDFAILSDGGLHHVFNSQQVPVYLLGAQKVNKPYFFKLKNGYFNDTLYNKCLFNCEKTILNMNGWPSLDDVCNLSCEQINPTAIGEDIVNFFNRK